MTYTLTIERKPTYLHAVVTGLNSPENVRGYMEEVFHECIARQCFRVLVEERLEGPRLEALDVYKLASAGASQFSGILQAMAYVDVNAQGELMQMAEDVAVARSFPVAVLASVADAERWLLRPGPAGPDSRAATAKENPRR